VKTATKIFVVAAVLGAAGGSLFLSSRQASADFAGPFAGGTQGTGGITNLETGDPLCLDGAGCTVKVVYDGGVIGLVGAEVDVPSGFYDSQKVNADALITPLGVVAQAPTGDYGFRSLHNTLWDFGDSTTDYCQSVSGEVQCASTWQWSSIEVDTIGASTPSRDRVEIFYPQPYPLSSLSTCDATHQGVLKTLSTTGRTYACDGTTNQRVGYTLAASAALDFPSLNNNDDATLTMTVTGAVSGDAVLCSPTAAIETGLQVSYSYVSASNTVTVVLHDASGGTVDPASATYKCTVIR
jgi:hypothetical protein